MYAAVHRISHLMRSPFMRLLVRLCAKVHMLPTSSMLMMVQVRESSCSEGFALGP